MLCTLQPATSLKKIHVTHLLKNIQWLPIVSQIIKYYLLNEAQNQIEPLSQKSIPLFLFTLHSAHNTQVYLCDSGFLPRNVSLFRFIITFLRYPPPRSPSRLYSPMTTFCYSELYIEMLLKITIMPSTKKQMSELLNFQELTIISTTFPLINGKRKKGKK